MFLKSVLFTSLKVEKEHMIKKKILENIENLFIGFIMRKKVFIGSKIERIEESDKKESFIPIKKFPHLFLGGKKNNFIENFFLILNADVKRGGLYFKIAVTCFICVDVKAHKELYILFLWKAHKKIGSRG